MASTTSIPDTTRPKTGCFRSSPRLSTTLMKNWLPPVFGPAFAMESVPLALRLFAGSSSLIVYPGPPNPVPCGSPPWIMKPAITRWKMLPHKRCQSFGQGGLLWLPSIGGIWDLFTCSTGAIEIPKTREKVSHALAIRPLKPTHSFHVDFLRRTKADLNGHRLVNLRWLESSAGFRPIETESEIDPVLRRGLHTGEGPPRGHQRHEGLARLDRDVPEAYDGTEHGIQDWPELRTIRVLPVYEFVRCGRHEIRVAEPFHDEERLGVSNHPLFRQPRSE